MRFTITDELDFPRDVVFEAHRDRLPEVAAYLPNVESIEVRRRDEDGDTVRLVNVWKAAATEIPGPVRPFIEPEQLMWIDTATWDRSAWTCHWDIEIGFLPGAIDARGKNHFTERDGKTRVTIEGEINVHGSKVPGVPRLLAGKIGGIAEKFVVKMIEPNLRETNRAVERYLSQTRDSS